VPDARKRIILHYLSNFIMKSEDGGSYYIDKEVYCAVILDESLEIIDEICNRGYTNLIVFCSSVIENYDRKVNEKVIIFDGLGKKVLKVRFI